MRPASSPEFLLAAACAMWPSSERRLEAIRAARPIDGAAFLRVVRRHRLYGLAHDGLTRAQPEIPQGVLDEIAIGAAALVQKNLRMARETLRLQRLFDDAALPALFVKGASLSVLAYGNVGLRHSGDIDLLVSSDSVAAAVELIESAGYGRCQPPPGTTDAQMRLLTPRRKDFGFIHRGTGIHVELHWRLFLNPHAMDESSVMASSRLVRLSDGDAVRTLGSEDLFAYLCLHGTLHWWNQLKWLADVGALLAVEQDGGERLLRAAELKGAGRAAVQAMLLCRQVLQTPVSSRVAAAGDGLLARWMQDTAFRTMAGGSAEQDAHDRRFGTTRGSLSALLIGRGWRYRSVEIGNLFTSEADVLSVPLPERLGFLYSFMRLPLWVWRHAIRREPRRKRIESQTSRP